MFGRFVSLTLIVAVIACPFRCGIECCHALGLSCAKLINEADADLLDDHSRFSDSRCCCDKSSPSDDQIPPAPCSDESSCQGICGGAVLEKPDELDRPVISFTLCPLGNEVLPRSVSTIALGQSDLFPECARSKNQGRCVRTLHRSFLL